MISLSLLDLSYLARTALESPTLAEIIFSAVIIRLTQVLPLMVNSKIPKLTVD